MRGAEPDEKQGPVVAQFESRYPGLRAVAGLC